MKIFIKKRVERIRLTNGFQLANALRFNEPPPRRVRRELTIVIRRWKPIRTNDARALIIRNKPLHIIGDALSSIIRELDWFAHVVV